MSEHTPGPWIVIEHRHPYKDGSKSHIERNIYTEREHPQLKGRYPIVCTSIGIGLDGKRAISFASIDEANAHLIAAAPDLLEQLTIARDRLADMLKNDDGQAFKEARKWLPGIEAAIAKATNQESTTNVLA